MTNITRLIETLMQPIGFIWLLNLLGAGWLIYRRKWRGAVFCGVVAILLFLVGSTSLPTVLLASLERPYANRPFEQILSSDAVVMLGGTLGPSHHDIFHFDFKDAADRVITAAELVRQEKAPVLIIGGPGSPGTPGQNDGWMEGRLLESWLKAWGLTNAAITCLKISASTHDEAMQVHELAKERGWKRIILVTSAHHMRRAEALFQKLGVSTIPAACDFTALNSLKKRKRFNPVPRLAGLEHFGLYLHEKIGWLAYRWRGWIDDGGSAHETR